MYAKKLMVVFLMTALVIAAVPSLTATACWTVLVYLD